jgi:TetR/AcrR family transcriptional regulator, tetracycline repressor protein
MPSRSVSATATATPRHPAEQGPSRRRRGGIQPLPLSRDDILAAALPLLERDGVDALTVRSVAEELGISSPAIYHYFLNRDDLVDRLCERVAATVDLTVDPATPWDDAVVAVIADMGHTFAQYPGVGSRVLTTSRPSPAAERMDATVLRLLSAGGFSPEKADDLLSALRLLFAGWLLGTARTVASRAPAPGLLKGSVRWLLRGSMTEAAVEAGGSGS